MRVQISSVEAVLVGGEERLDLLRGVGDGGRADRLVGLLGVLGLALEDPRLGQGVFLAEQAADDLAGLGRWRPGEGHRVGTHVGDQADRALADVDPLVELLGGAHGLAGREAELAARLLLQGAGGEGGGGVALLLAAGDAGDAVSPGRQGRATSSSACASSAMANLSSFLPSTATRRALEGLGPGAECRAGRRWSSIRWLLEGLDLLLPVADQAQRHRLDPAGGEAVADLLPEKGREVEADQIVEDRRGPAGRRPGRGRCGAVRPSPSGSPPW